MKKGSVGYPQGNKGALMGDENDIRVKEPSPQRCSVFEFIKDRRVLP